MKFESEIETATIRVTSKGGAVLVNERSQEALLIFLKSNQTLKIENMKPPIDPKELETAANRGSSVSTTANALAFAGIGVGTVAIVFQLPFMNFLIKFILIMKIINRFKLINIDYGELLDKFLGGIFNIFETSDTKIETQNFKFDTKNRGKLSFYETEVVIFFDLYPKYILYAVKNSINYF